MPGECQFAENVRGMLCTRENYTFLLHTVERYHMHMLTSSVSSLNGPRLFSEWRYLTKQIMDV